MKMPNGYNETMAAGSWQPLASGGYVCRILNAREEMTRTNKPMVVVQLEIAEGDEAGRFGREFAADTRDMPKWPASGVMRQLTEDKDGRCSPFFKAMITSLEKSNEGWHPQWDDGFCKSLQGKFIGVVYGREQYEKSDGTIAFATKPQRACSVAEVREGRILPPEDKLLKTASAPASSGWSEMSDSQLPF